MEKKERERFKESKMDSASLLFQLFTFVSLLNLNGLSSRIRVTSSFTWDFKNILTPLYNGPIKAWAVKLNNVPYIIDNRSKTMLLAGGNNVI